MPRGVYEAMGEGGGGILEAALGETDSANLTDTSSWRTMQVINDAICTTFTSSIENGADLQGLTLPAGLVINCKGISRVIISQEIGRAHV